FLPQAAPARAKNFGEIQMKRTTESTIALAIVRVLRRKADKKATIQELVEAIPHHVRLTKADRAPSKTRPQEKIWEQRLRNLKSHKREKVYGLKPVPGGFALA